jgi:nitrogen-specific signal transduction histidine kinase
MQRRIEKEQTALIPLILNLCRNATEYTNNHEYKDAVEITLHFINIKELKFVYRHNRNKLARALVAYL